MVVKVKVKVGERDVQLLRSEGDSIDTVSMVLSYEGTEEAAMPDSSVMERLAGKYLHGGYEERDCSRPGNCIRFSVKRGFSKEDQMAFHAVAAMHIAVG